MESRSELEWLDNDIQEIRRLFETNPQLFQSLADVHDPDRHARYLVVADLTWQIWHHAAGVYVLLREGIYTSMLVIQRAIFEALVTLAYIVKHPDSQNEAVVLLAHSYIQDINHFSHQQELVKERSEILTRMPAHLVERARSRAEKQPRTWSGKTIRQMANEAGIEGYSPTYRFMSAEAHATAIGRHVRTLRTGDIMKIETGRQVTPEEVEAAANFARRALHAAFKIMWSVFDGPSITISSTDPEGWRHSPPHIAT